MAEQKIKSYEERACKVGDAIKAKISNDLSQEETGKLDAEAIFVASSFRS